METDGTKTEKESSGITKEYMLTRPVDASYGSLSFHVLRKKGKSSLKASKSNVQIAASPFDYLFCPINIPNPIMLINSPPYRSQLEFLHLASILDRSKPSSTHINCDRIDPGNIHHLITSCGYGHLHTGQMQVSDPSKPNLWMF